MRTAILPRYVSNTNIVSESNIIAAAVEAIFPEGVARAPVRDGFHPCDERVESLYAKSPRAVGICDTRTMNAVDRDAHSSEGRRTKRGYHHGNLREQLVAGTRALIEEKGPQGFSLAEACRAAGVSTAAPYRHFEDRRELIVEVALVGMREMREDFLDVLAPIPRGTLDSITAIGLAYIRYATRNPGVFRIMFADHGPHASRDEAGQALYAVLLDEVRGFLGAGAAAERVLETSFPLWTFVHGLSFLVIDGKAECEMGMTDLDTVVRRGTERLLAPG